MIQKWNFFDVGLSVDPLDPPSLPPGPPGVRSIGDPWSDVLASLPERCVGVLCMYDKYWSECVFGNRERVPTANGNHYFAIPS